MLAAPAPLFFWNGLSGEVVLLGLLGLAVASAGYFYYRMRREDREEQAALDRELDQRLGVRNKQLNERKDSLPATDELGTDLAESKPAPVPSLDVAADEEPLPEFAIQSAPAATPTPSSSSEPVVLATPEEVAPIAEDAAPCGPATREAPLPAVPETRIVVVEAKAHGTPAIPAAEQIVIASTAEERPPIESEVATAEDETPEVAPPRGSSPVSIETAPLDSAMLRPVFSPVLRPESLPPSSKRVLHRNAQMEVREKPAAQSGALESETPAAAASAQSWIVPRATSASGKQARRGNSRSPFEGLRIIADSQGAAEAREELLSELAREARRRRTRRMIALGIFVILILAVTIVFAVPSARSRLMPKIRPLVEKTEVLFGLKAPQELVKTIPPDVECADYRLRTNVKANTFEFGGEVTNLSPSPMTGLRVEIELQSRALDAKTELQLVPLDTPTLAPGLTGTFHLGGSAKDFQSAKVGRVIGPDGEPLRVRYKGVKEWPLSTTATVQNVKTK